MELREEAKVGGEMRGRKGEMNRYGEVEEEEYTLGRGDNKLIL